MRLCVVLLVANLAFIWGNSLMPAELSRSFSQWVKGILDFLLPSIGSDEPGEGHHLLRKLAHLTEFACLGFLLSWLVRMLRESKREHYFVPLLLGALVAGLDECIQIFVPERGPGILDVGIDTLGVTLGITLMTLYVSIKHKSWKKTGVCHSENAEGS